MEAALRGRVAVVTGASRGIGAAIAEGYARHGASVVGIGRDGQRLEAVRQRIVDAGGRFESAAADVTDENALADAFAVAQRAFGGVDVVVANAGIDTPSTAVAEAPAELWQRVLDTNLIGVATTIRLAVAHLQARGGGHIITMGSGLGGHGLPGSAVYAASKAALTRLTQVAAVELASAAIAVNELIPGPVVTEVTEVTEGSDADDGLVAKAFPGEWRKRPEDVVPLALFLATQPTPGPTGQSFSLMRR